MHHIDINWLAYLTKTTTATNKRSKKKNISSIWWCSTLWAKLNVHERRRWSRLMSTPIHIILLPRWKRDKRNHEPTDTILLSAGIAMARQRPRGCRLNAPSDWLLWYRAVNSGTQHLRHIHLLHINSIALAYILFVGRNWTFQFCGEWFELGMASQSKFMAY